MSFDSIVNDKICGTNNIVADLYQIKNLGSGKLNLGLDFNGVNQYADIVSLQGPTTCSEDIEQCLNGLSIAMWLKIKPMTNNNNNRVIIYGGLSYGAYQLWLSPNLNTLMWQGRLFNGYRVRAAADVSQYTDQWIHVAGRLRPGGNTTIFIDGHKISQNTMESEAAGSNSPGQFHLYFGTRKVIPGYYANVTIDDFYLWDTYISENFVASLFAQTS